MAFGIRKKAGVIGLGIIGSRVAENLRNAGFRTFVWNRSPRPEPNFLGSPAEVADACRHIQIFVADEVALRTCLEALLPSLGRQHIILNHATISPGFTREACAMVEERGASFLDAPFTGSREAAARGELVYYIGGDEAVLDKVRDQLDASSKKILHFGEVGHAMLLKLATNIISAATAQTLAEALALVQRAGVAPEKLAEAISYNACKSGVTELKVGKMIGADYEPHFSVKHMFKDVRFALHEANELGLDLPSTAAAGAALLAALHQGHGDLDFSALAINYGFEPVPPEAPQEDAAPESGQEPPAPSEESEVAPEPDEAVAAPDEAAPPEAPEPVAEEPTDLSVADLAGDEPEK